MKKKLRLNELEVQSFVTEIKEEEALRLKTGNGSDLCTLTNGICFTRWISCRICVDAEING